MDFVHFTTKGPFYVENSQISTGTQLLQLNFQNPANVNEIKFKNYYTAFLSIYVQRSKIIKEKSVEKNPAENGKKRSKDGRSISEEESSDWELSIAEYICMERPDTENGSQNYFLIQQNKSSVSWNNIISIRFILHQPSKIWKKFKIEEIGITKSGSKFIEPEVVDFGLFERTRNYLIGWIVEGEDFESDEDEVN